MRCPLKNKTAGPQPRELDFKKGKEETMQGYTDHIRHYAMDNRFTGELSDADGVGEVGLGSQEAGKRLAVRFTLKLTDQQIETIRFKVFGCGFTIAACAAAAELAQGRSLNEVRNYSPTIIDQALGGLPEERNYCAELAVQALQAAVASAETDRKPVQASISPEDEHGPRLTPDNPVYRALVDSVAPDGIPQEDRQLFACVLAVTNQEPALLQPSLNLSPRMLTALLLRAFPGIDRLQLFGDQQLKTASPPEINPQLEELLARFIPDDSWGWGCFCSMALAKILAARAAHPGHLWIAMGLFERQDLTAAIARHLPALIAANSQGMRWKRFLFKQICDLNGGVMCKSPVCGDCSDYALCFKEE